MTESKIEWTGRSDWNPVRGCTRVSPGCGGPGDHGGCYAEAMAARFSLSGMWGHGFAEMKDGKPRWTGKVELQEDRLLMPLSWRKPGFIFPNSTSDFFHEALGVPAIAKLVAVMAMCPHLTFQVLTKRAERMRAIVGHPEFRNEVELAAERIKPSVGMWCSPKWSFAWPLPNVWLGTSTERQEEADERIPHLFQTPAAVRFLSCEPLIGPIDLRKIKSCGWLTSGWAETDAFSVRINGKPALDWVIAGGESGPRARPMHPDWARSLRDQCAAAGVPFFFKQHGEWLSVNDDIGQISYATHQVHTWGGPEVGGDGACYRVGKKAAGRLLDGVEHNGMPKVAA